MLRRIRIKNFQAHEDSEVDLGPGINIFTGENDCGKTSIFRSIAWVKDNRPLGTSFIRKNQNEDAEVEIETEECTVSRIRGEKRNEYRLSGVEEPFDSFGQNPPPDIVEALNLSDINIQTQLETPFLVLSSPGQVAQHIRSLSGLELLDNVVSNLKGKISNKNSELGTYQNRLEEREKELSRIQKIDIQEFEQSISRMEELIQENEEIDRIEKQLISLIVELETLEKEWIILPDDIEEILNSIPEKCTKISTVQEKIDDLKNRIEELSEIERDWINLPEDLDTAISQCSQKIENLSKIEEDLEKLTRIVNELDLLDGEILEIPIGIETINSSVDSAINQYNITEEKIQEMTILISELDQIETDLDQNKREEEVHQKEFFILLGQIEKCPYCESKLVSETKENLLKNS